MDNKRAEWLYHAQWGVFMHFLGALPSTMEGADLTAEKWNKQVDAFDVKGLARQLHEMKAPYVFLTLGQNSGHYCSPNATYDRLVGHRPSKCSRRDLVADLYEVIAPYGIRLLVYLPALGPAADVTALENLKCTPPWKPGYLPHQYHVVDGVDDRLTEFQHNWEAVIREWSTRWGKKVCGWWIDGCYNKERLYDFPDEPNFRSFAAAMRSGNSDSIVAWNPGVKYPPYTMNEEEDYTAGEINDLEKIDQPGRRVKQAQFHVLTYIGTTWGALPVRYSAEEVIDYSRWIIDCGGVVTWDVSHTPEGLIDDDAYRPLKELSKAIGSQRRSGAKPPQLPHMSFRLARGPYITPEKSLMPGQAHITLHNHWSTPISGKVSFQPSGASDNMIRVEPPIDYHIAPGTQQEIEQELVWTRPEPMQARVKVTLSQADGGCSVYYTVPVRKAIRLPLLPAGTRLDDLPKALADKESMRVCVNRRSDAKLVDREMAVIRLGLAGKCIGILFEVEDSLIQRTPSYWDGSCIEVFAAANDSAPIGQLFLAPATEGKGDAVMRVSSDGFVPVAQVEFRTIRKQEGYTGCALVPIPWLIGSEIMPDNFLFEIAVNAGVQKIFKRGVLFGEWIASVKTEGYGLISRRK